MNLYETFLTKIQKNGFSAKNIRFLSASRLLRNELSKYKSISEYSKLYKINSGSLSSMLKDNRAIPLSLIRNNKNLSQYKIIIDNSNIAVKIPTKITKELAYLVGVLRDRTVSQESRNEYVVAFYNKDIKLLETISKLLKEIFDLDNKVEKHWNTVYRVRIRSKTLYLFFKVIFDTKKKQVIWDTPKLVRNSSDIIKKYYITGFFDAEGGCPHFENDINIKKKNLYAKFVQKNKESLEFIKEHLEKMNIQTGRIYWEDGKYVLKISNSSIPFFCKYIKPFHSMKAFRLKRLYENFAL